MPNTGLFLPHLRRLRQERLMSQRELAERSGVTPATLVALENQRSAANYRTIERLAKALGVSPTDMMDESLTAADASPAKPRQRRPRREVPPARPDHGAIAPHPTVSPDADTPGPDAERRTDID